MVAVQGSSGQSGLGALNANIIFLLLGVYGWEYIHSLHVEWALIRRRLAFRLAMIPYILGRICLFLFLVMFAAGTSASPSVNCLPGALAVASFGDIAIGCSSMNFLIRTWVIWKDSRWAHALLLLLALGQWAMLVLDATMIKSVIVNGSCVVYLAHPQINAVTIMYSTFSDLLVLVMSVVGLSYQRSESPLKRRLRSQGLLYFAVAGMGYVPPVIAALLDDMPIYVLTSNAAITISTIVSSRAVRSLYSFETSNAGETLDSNIALTTQIGIHPTFLEEAPPCGRPGVDDADRC